MGERCRGPYRDRRAAAHKRAPRAAKTSADAGRVSGFMVRAWDGSDIAGSLPPTAALGPDFRRLA